MCLHGSSRSQCADCAAAKKTATDYRYVCHHGRSQYYCRDCGGSGLCVHGRHRNRCHDCGGSGICEHGRRRHVCRDCGGTGICAHGRQRYTCAACGYVDRRAHHRASNREVAAAAAAAAAAIAGLPGVPTEVDDDTNDADMSYDSSLMAEVMTASLAGAAHGDDTPMPAVDSTLAELGLEEASDSDLMAAI